MATLRPPKADLFSDEVICAVNPRIRSIPRHFTVQFQTDKSKGDVKSKSPIKPRVIKSKSAIMEDHRRERCRQYQARYCEKQRVLTLSLQDDISKLQREVWELTLLRSSACVGIPIRQNSWLVVMEYFRIFQLGFTAPTLELQTFVRNFLRKSMALDVTDGTLCGVEAMMEHWTLISLCFADFHVQLKRLESGDDMDTLVATTITSVTITTETLRRVFPHLLVSDANFDVARSAYHHARLGAFCLGFHERLRGKNAKPIGHADTDSSTFGKLRERISSFRQRSRHAGLQIDRKEEDLSLQRCRERGPHGKLS